MCVCVCVCMCTCVCGSSLWQACVKVCVCVCQAAFFLCAWLPYWFPLRGGWQLGARCIILLRSLTIPYLGRGDIGLTISTAGAASRHGPDGLCLLSGCCVASPCVGSPCVGSPCVRRDNVLLLSDYTLLNIPRWSGRHSTHPRTCNGWCILPGILEPFCESGAAGCGSIRPASRECPYCGLERGGLLMGSYSCVDIFGQVETDCG